MCCSPASELSTFRLENIKNSFASHSVAADKDGSVCCTLSCTHRIQMMSSAALRILFQLFSSRLFFFHRFDARCGRLCLSSMCVCVCLFNRLFFVSKWKEWQPEQQEKRKEENTRSLRGHCRRRGIRRVFALTMTSMKKNQQCALEMRGRESRQKKNKTL